MKKVLVIGFVLILLVASAAPAMAGNGQSNGQGHGQNNGNGGQDKHLERNQDRTRDRLQHSERDRGSSGHADKQSNRMRTPFYLQGVISAIDGTAKTITVSVVHGNSRVKQFIGTDLIVATTETTKFYQINQNGDAHEDRELISFEQLQVGQKVAIHGDLIESIFTARLVTVYIPKAEEPPEEPYP